MSDIERTRKEIYDITQRQYIIEPNAYDEYYDKVRELTNRFPKEISVHDYIYNYRYQYNCYAYALSLGNSDQYFEMCRKQQEKYPGDNGAQSDFISYLIEKEYLKELINSIENCLVIYFDDQKNPKHAGILQKNVDGNEKIISKWGNLKFIRTYSCEGIECIAGTTPIIFAHKLWYVPTDYGTGVKYYEPLSKEKSEKYFDEFLTNVKGISLDGNSN